MQMIRTLILMVGLSFAILHQGFAQSVWTSRNPLPKVATTMTSVVWNGEKLAISSSGGYTSRDGITWTGSSGYGLTINNELIYRKSNTRRRVLTLNDNSMTCILTSPDGGVGPPTAGQRNSP